MEMIRPGASPPACEQQFEADALLSLDDLIRLLPSCLPTAWPERRFSVLPGRRCQAQCLGFLSTAERSGQSLHVTFP